MNYTTLEEKAQLYATVKHHNQFRKDGITPYITHPKAVVKLLKELNVIKNNDIYVAAWLHDVIEDCEVTRDELEREFNPFVANVVEKLTRNCSREDYKERIRKANYAIQIIKLADVVHNCSDLGTKLSEKTIQRKVEDCKDLYFQIASEICPDFQIKLVKSLEQYLTKEETRRFTWLGL